MTVPRSVRINRLVLDGIEAHQRAAVVSALHTELARLFREHPDSVPPTRTNAPTVGSPADIGRAAAAAVHAKVVQAC
jgi:hypothetical protein